MACSNAGQAINDFPPLALRSLERCPCYHRGSAPPDTVGYTRANFCSLNPQPQRSRPSENPDVNGCACTPLPLRPNTMSRRTFPITGDAKGTKLACYIFAGMGASSGSNPSISCDGYPRATSKSKERRPVGLIRPTKKTTQTIHV